MFPAQKIVLGERPHISVFPRFILQKCHYDCWIMSRLHYIAIQLGCLYSVGNVFDVCSPLCRWAFCIRRCTNHTKHVSRKQKCPLVTESSDIIQAIGGGGGGLHTRQQIDFWDLLGYDILPPRTAYHHVLQKQPAVGVNKVAKLAMDTMLQ